MRLVKFILFGLIVVALGILTILVYYCHDLPDTAQIISENEKKLVKISYSNNATLALKGKAYDSLNYYELPTYLVEALIATEDRRFFTHRGVDLIGITRAAFVNYSKHRISEGGSTITQQLAKLLFLKPERTLKRKIQEVCLALKLEKDLGKEEILTSYLAHAYFGSGNYGIKSAARAYFGKDVAEINLKEASILVALLKAPSRLSPKDNKWSKAALRRSREVLQNMKDVGFIDDSDIKNAERKTVAAKENLNERLYFADFVYDQFDGFLSKSHTSPLIITTTLDEEIERKLESVLIDFTRTNAKKLGKSELAVVVMRKDGAVVGMAGGKDYAKGPFNRATYSKRQAGSAFKTFIYLAAFENGFTVNDEFDDKPIHLGNWAPENFDQKYLGRITLKQAFATSANSVAVQLMQKVGYDKVAAVASNLGILSKVKSADQTVALGTVEVSVLEITSAYASIANAGEAVIPYYITKIEDPKGEVLYVRNSSGLNKVISDSALACIKEVMRSAVADGTGKLANIGPDIYGKTGTSQNFRDAWFIGFNRDYVVGVWIGNDDNSPTNKITGGSLPAVLFANILKQISD